MRKLIFVRDLENDYVIIQMDEDFKDSVKYLPPEYKQLIEQRHKAPDDEMQESG